MGGKENMIKVFATTLNVHDRVHPVARYALETLAWADPDRFLVTASISDSDCVLVNAPACAPYVFDQRLANEIIAAKKPVFIINDADGAMPDCEGQLPDKEHNFQNFVRGGNGIKAYFYREWFAEYERPDLPFPLLPFELVGYLWTNHPKDKKQWPVQTEAEFNARPLDILFAQSLNQLSRIELHNALKSRPRTSVTDLRQPGTRLPADEWMDKQATAKITVALEGAGVKCCSTYEAPVNSVMAMSDIRMHESYPWLDGINCIRLRYERNKGEGSLVHNFGRGVVMAPEACGKMQAFLDMPERLYELYRNGIEHAQKYSLPNYWKNYVGNQIAHRL